MVSSGGLDTPNFLLINPLLDGGEADPQLQGSVAKFQQAFRVLLGFGAPLHRNEIVPSTPDAVNTLSPPLMEPGTPFLNA
jgi:hypothetical protein